MKDRSYLSILVLVTLFFAPQIVSADPLDNWTLRNQNYTSPSLMSVTYGNGTLVAIGGHGGTITSLDGITWEEKTSGTNSYLRDVAYGNGIFVAVGQAYSPSEDIILTSLDGVTWVSRLSDPSRWFNRVCYANGLFVAVGLSIFTSPDGITWTEINGTDVSMLNGVAYGNGRYVVLREGAEAFISIDGITWDRNFLDPSLHRVSGLAYGKGVFVGVGDNGNPSSTKIIIRTSSDGINWEEKPLDFSVNWFNRSIIYANGMFVIATGRPNLLTSPDGKEWSLKSPPLTPSNLFLFGATYGKGSFFVVGDCGTILQSDRFYSGNMDFDGDGKPDILWRNPSSGRTTIWYMEEAKWNGKYTDILPSVSGSDWTIAGVADFDNDANPDLLWRNGITGQTTIWYMNGATWNGQYADVWPQVIGSDWSIAGIADFNNDNKPDLLWRNVTTGQTTVWHMDGPNWTGGYDDVLPSVNGLEWKIVGVADFNNDSKPDLLWRNITTGRTTIWYMNAATWTGEYADVTPTVSDTDWQIVAVQDFNGDGIPDLLWRNASTYRTTVWYMDGPTWNGNWGDFLPVVSDPSWVIIGR